MSTKKITNINKNGAYDISGIKPNTTPKITLKND